MTNGGSSPLRPSCVECTGAIVVNWLTRPMTFQERFNEACMRGTAPVVCAARLGRPDGGIAYSHHPVSAYRTHGNERLQEAEWLHATRRRRNLLAAGMWAQPGE